MAGNGPFRTVLGAMCCPCAGSHSTCSSLTITHTSTPLLNGSGSRDAIGSHGVGSFASQEEGRAIRRPSLTLIGNGWSSTYQSPEYVKPLLASRFIVFGVMLANGPRNPLGRTPNKR